MKKLHDIRLGLDAPFERRIGEASLKFNGRWKPLCWLALAFGVLGLSAFPCIAQSNYTFITIAGSPTNGTADGIGTDASFNSPKSLAAGLKYDVYVSDTGNDTIRRISTIQTNWSVTTIAGVAGVTGTNDNPTNALLAHFNGNTGIAINSAGNIFVADAMNNTIRELAPFGSNNWSVTTIAGMPGISGTNDDSTNALLGKLNHPWGIGIDASNNVYVADTFNQTIRIISPVGAGWGITTIAGAAGMIGTNDGSGKSAFFNYPKGIAVDSAGDIFVADTTNNTIRKITGSGTNWTVSTVAGRGRFTGHADGTNANASFFAPAGIAVDNFSNLYVADTGNETVRKIVPSGTNNVVTTIGGIAGVTGYQDGTYTNVQFTDLEGICVDSLGNLFLDGNNVQAGVITLVVQGPNSPSFAEIEVVVGPQAALDDGGAWTLENSGYGFGVQPYTLPATTFPAYVVFTNINGWNVPVSAPIQVTSAFCLITDLSYTVIPPVLNVSRTPGLGITGTANTSYRIDYTTDLKSGSWQTLMPSIQLGSGLNQIASWPPPWPANNNASSTYYRAVWLGN